MKSSRLFRSLLLLFLMTCRQGSLPAQPRYALEASSGCWGEVPADPALSPTPSWTAEGWVYLLDDADRGQPILGTDSQDGNYELKIVDGRAAASLTILGATVLTATGQTPLPLGAWAHIAICYDGAGLHLYLNGTEETATPGPGNPAVAPGPIFIAGSGSDQMCGLADEIRLSDTVRYTGAFDPFNVPLVDLRVGDQVVPGWALGAGPGDLVEAWDYASLYAIIDGMAEVYISHNFQYALRQYYYGQIAGHDVRLTLWMTDQGTAEDAEALYQDPLIVPPAYQPIQGIGAEARMDTSLLWDYKLDFWRDKYYVSVTLNKEWDPSESWQAALDFGAEADSSILDSDHFPADSNTIALWHFDEGLGAIFGDASGNGHDGALTNPAWAATTPYQAVLYITSAQLLEGNVQSMGIDEDDTARVTFSAPVEPVSINAANIDQVLGLSAGHSWLSGNGQLGAANWNAAGDTLWITFLTEGGAPTLADGDTLVPNSETLISTEGLAAGGYRFVRFDEISGINANNAACTPQTLELLAPHPMPFNARTRITYQLPRLSHVTLSIMDVSGREVFSVYRGFEQSGMHSFVWDAETAASGLYFIILRADAEQLVAKAVLVK